MDNNSQTQQSIQKKSPTELLLEQTQSLTELTQIQKTQGNQLGELIKQNNDLLRQLEEIQTGTHVKIEDINMPFGALVGFMLKVSFAAIPAGIVLGLLYAVVLAIFTGILGSL